MTLDEALKHHTYIIYYMYVEGEAVHLGLNQAQEKVYCVVTLNEPPPTIDIEDYKFRYM